MAKDFKKEYQYWLESNLVDEKTKEELRSIEGEEKEIEERFYRDLDFGTAGLRGVLGAGCNRMNIYTVRRTTQGIANYINSVGKEAAERGVVISYDCRHYSPEFAMESAKVLAANGVRAYVFDEMNPTPVLSFAVRHLHTFAGIMITASHNPAKYNGYKVYGEDGAQLGVAPSAHVMNYIEKMDIFKDVSSVSEEEGKASGLIRMVGKEVVDAFLAEVIRCSIHPELIQKAAEDFKIVYTPFHGTGYKAVCEILKTAGFRHVYPVKEQVVPDPDFSTVKSPNPEDKEGFYLAISLAKEIGADVIIGTDPDSDRIGVLAKNESGDYDVLTGNQTGELLTDYVLSEKSACGEIGDGDYIVKTIVTTDLVKKIAAHYGVRVYDVFTGFKNIAEVIKSKEGKNEGEYLFGFEESYGYLPGTYARDKDAVAAALLACEMAAVYKLRGIGLRDALLGLYKKYGCFTERTVSVVMEGIDGMEKMAKLMSDTAANPPKALGDVSFVAMRNYLEQKRYDFQNGGETPIDMVSTNVLYFELEGGGFFIMRPSGTEPKIKFYYSVPSESIEDGEKKIDALEAAAKKEILKQ